MTARRIRCVRTAAVCGWAALVLAAPGIAYVAGGLLLLAWLIHDLAADADRIDSESTLTADERAWLDSLDDWNPHP